MYKVEFHTQYKNIVLVVGCGGTGSYVAEGLVRLLPESYNIILQDHDRVEERNLLRQNFYPADLGKFKAQTLAERLSANYRRTIGYKVAPYGMVSTGLSTVPTIIIGCVDNANARRALASYTGYTTWWIDSGNGYQSGQVLIGNGDEEMLKHHFANQMTTALPKPSLQLPSLLDPMVPEIGNKPVVSCAEAVEREEQSPLINQMMATLVLQAVNELIHNRLTWMAAFANMEAGTLSTVAIEPKTIAQICGVRVDTLMK